ncbi:MAG: gamma-glutamyltransferase [Acidobacteriota bacterium]|nr:gamma-glutamyltransferase [Acidobacteriota bacterium]
MPAQILRAAATLAICAMPLFAQATWGRNYGRSMVISQGGIAATSQILASQTAAAVLGRGGSAADAAIAANAVLGVVEPMMDGVGGDLFVLYWDAAARRYAGLNASGSAPRALTPAFLKAKGITEMPAEGIHSVTVPGAVEGWYRMHERYGKLPWKDLFADAIFYADKGFPVSEIIQEAWADSASVKRLHADPETLRVFLPAGKPPAVGDIFRNPDLARTLRLIAAQGPSVFYKGEIAAAILKTSERLGGAMTAADLASFTPEWVTPISTVYRDARVFELPPNGQGMAALEMLNIMATAKPDSEPFSTSEMHMRIEAMKLAYADLKRYNADPRSSDVPVAKLLSPEWAAERAAKIDPNRANCDVPPGNVLSGDTTYLTVIDRDGNMASWIQSVSQSFGSGITVDGTGILLQDRGGYFSLDPDSPNVLAGGKRPFHTIIPAFMERGGTRTAFGIMGGLNQPLAHAQFVSNIVDYGMNIQAALEAPRFTKKSIGGCDVSIESRVPLDTLQGLSEKGHIIGIRRPYTPEMGRGQAIMRDEKTNTNYAASDPRTDGAAIPEPLPH